MLWLNGTFGVGKTTTAKSIATMTDRWRVFDAEIVGYMLRAYLDGVDFNDFQDLSAWRRLVPSVAMEVTSLTGADLLVVQSVLIEGYWSELSHGTKREGLDVFHVVLDCDESVLRDRITDDEDDPGAAEWRMSHVDAYLSARGWMVAAADLVVDTTRAEPQVVASRILDALK
jgi:broad-specificity NMP kinase